MKRYYVIDYLRAFVIINMIIYHLLWDMVYLCGHNIMWFNDIAGVIWQRFICISFIMISGFCWSFSKNHIKRGLVILCAGAAVSLVTAVFMPEAAIRYGILTLIGSAVVIMVPAERGFVHINAAAGLIISIVLFFIFRDTAKGYIAGFNVPEIFYSGGIMNYIGFMEEGFVSADYFPLLPWLFLFFAGYFLCRVLMENNLLENLKGRNIPFISAVSRNSLLIYLIHQPVVYSIARCIAFVD